MIFNHKIYSALFFINILKCQELSKDLNGPEIALEIIFSYSACILLMYFSSIALYPTVNSASKLLSSMHYLDDKHHGKNSGYNSTSITISYNCFALKGNTIELEYLCIYSFSLAKSSSAWYEDLVKGVDETIKSLIPKLFFWL